jgi:hypothetical protein
MHLWYKSQSDVNEVGRSNIIFVSVYVLQWAGPSLPQMHKDFVTSERGGPSPYTAVEPWLLLYVLHVHHHLAKTHYIYLPKPLLMRVTSIHTRFKAYAGVFIIVTFANVGYLHIKGIHKRMARFQKNSLLIPHHSFVYALYLACILFKYQAM